MKYQVYSVESNKMLLGYKLWILLLLNCANIYSANIIFDMGGVLLGTKKMPFIKKPGIVSLSMYSTFHFKKPRTALFQQLSNVEPIQKTTIKPCDDLGAGVPCIMHDWLKGTPSADILTKAKPHMKKTKPIWRLAKSMFDPHIMADSQVLIPSAKKLVEKYVAQGHSVYILSNWDGESFKIIRQRHPEFFNQFSGIVLSGECGMLKPDSPIFNHLLDTYKLEPASCVFIDNQQNNIDGASKVGIKGILLSKTRNRRLNFAQAEKELDAWLSKQSTRQQKSKKL